MDAKSPDYYIEETEKSAEDTKRYPLKINPFLPAVMLVIFTMGYLKQSHKMMHHVPDKEEKYDETLIATYYWFFSGLSSSLGTLGYVCQFFLLAIVNKKNWFYTDMQSTLPTTY